MGCELKKINRRIKAKAKQENTRQRFKRGLEEEIGRRKQDYRLKDN